MAGGALLVPHQVDLLLAAQRRLLKGHGDVHAQIVAGDGAVLARAAAEAAAEHRGKDVLEAAEATAAEAAEIAKPAAAEAARLGAVVAELVVLRPLLGVGQHLVGLVDLLELLLGGLVAGVHVRVVLLRQLAIGLLDGRLVRALLEAKDLVVVSFVSHYQSPSDSGNRVKGTGNRNSCCRVFQ